MMTKPIKCGFYCELEDLRDQGLSDASFGFLENIDVGEYFNLYDFLHGHCDEFAAALSDYYGYGIEYILDTANVLIHAYCTADLGGVKAYIDARGITTDSAMFFDEFSDFCTFDNGRFFDLKGECNVLTHKNTQEMYGDENREPNQDADLIEFFKNNNSYYDVFLLERIVDVESYTEKSAVPEVLYILTTRSMWSDNVSQRNSFVSDAFCSLQEAQDKCRKFDVASHMIPGVEEVRVLPNGMRVKTGEYWELKQGQFEKILDVKSLANWPDGVTLGQYLKVGDRVDNAMYEHFLNILPPQYYRHNDGVLQVGGACDVVKNEDGVYQNTYLTFVRDNKSDFWVFKGECFSREWINRNPELEPVKKALDDQIGLASSGVQNTNSPNENRNVKLEQER